MKPMYMRMVEIGNQGSQDLGFDGLSDLWFSKYDMPADKFLDETDRVWEEVKPLYEALHCHVRSQLNAKYGDEEVLFRRTIASSFTWKYVGTVMG